VSPMRYEQGFYISEDDILHSHHRENLKPYEKRNASNPVPENLFSSYLEFQIMNKSRESQ
jgi:hypothetical protein